MRAIGPNELIKLRSDRQSIQLYLAIHKPTTVFTARVNQATFTDPVSEITYDGGVGTYGNILPEMIMLVGSSAGARDKGIVRIRKAASATVLYIGLTSEIVWEDDDYLTVLDFMPASVKVTTLAGETLYMDGDIEYSDQHTDFNPIPIIGNHVAGFLEDGLFSLIVDASDSYVLGDTIASYLWTAPGASATANLDTATPTITYNSAGTYRVGCTVTATNGKTTTAYRYVLLYDEDNMPIQEFEITRLVGSVEEGGWEFAAKVYEDISDVLPNAMCILFAKDYYDLEQVSLGYVAGSEQVIAIGWIDEESSEFDYQLGIGSLYVYGLHHVLSRISGYPITLYAADNEPSTWKELGTPTVDESLFHLMYWRSNIIQITDVVLSGDTRRMPEIELPVDNLWNQIVEVSERRMLARACCNRYNKLYVEIPSSLLEPDDKALITTVMDIEKQDWGAKVNIEYSKSKVALLELSGLLDDTPEQVIMTKAPGLVPKSYGSFESYDNLVFDNQAHANTLSGLMLALLNNEYPFVDVFLAQNNRFIDICPNQYVTIDLVATDTPRRVVWTDKKLRVNRVIFEHDPTKGSLQTGLECATETANTSSEYSDGITVIPPQPVEPNIDPGVDPGDFPIFPEPNINFPPYVPTPPPIDEECLTRSNGGYSLYWDKSLIISSETESERTTKAYYPCNIRDTGSYPTKLRIEGTFYKYNSVSNIWEIENTDNSWYTLDAIDSGGNVVATADAVLQIDVDTKEFTFSVGGNADIWGFRLSIDELAEAGYAIGTEVATGSADADASAGVTMTTEAVIGNYYTVISSGGPGYIYEYPDHPDYTFRGQVDYGSGWQMMGAYEYGPTFGRIGWYAGSGTFAYKYRSGNYERVFFKALSATLKFGFWDSTYNDNSGSLNYTLNEASLSEGNKIVLSGALLYNVCPAS